MCTYAEKTTDKTYLNIRDIKLIKYFEANSPTNTTTIKNIIKYQITHLGNVTIKDEKYKGCIIVIDLDIKYSPKLKIYALANGGTFDVKIDKKTFNKNKVNVGDIIIVNKQKSKPKMSRNADGSFSPIVGSSEWWLEDYKRIEVS
jgi:hypothetical protein